MRVEDVKGYSDKKLKKMLDKFTEMYWADNFIIACNMNSRYLFDDLFEIWGELINESKERMKKADHKNYYHQDNWNVLLFERLPLKMAEAKYESVKSMVRLLGYTLDYKPLVPDFSDCKNVDVYKKVLCNDTVHMNVNLV